MVLLCWGEKSEKKWRWMNREGNNWTGRLPGSKQSLQGYILNDSAFKTEPLVALGCKQRGKTLICVSMVPQRNRRERLKKWHRCHVICAWFGKKEPTSTPSASNLSRPPLDSAKVPLRFGGSKTFLLGVYFIYVDDLMMSRAAGYNKRATVVDCLSFCIFYLGWWSNYDS